MTLSECVNAQINAPSKMSGKVYVIRIRRKGQDTIYATKGKGRWVGTIHIKRPYQVVRVQPLTEYVGAGANKEEIRIMNALDDSLHIN